MITTDNLEKVYQIVLNDRRIKIKEIAEPVNISKERVCQLTEELGMRKLNTRRIPRILTVDQKRI